MSVCDRLGVQLEPDDLTVPPVDVPDLLTMWADLVAAKNWPDGSGHVLAALMHHVRDTGDDALVQVVLNALEEVGDAL